MNWFCLVGLHRWRDRFKLTHMDGTGAIEVTVCMECGRIKDHQWPPSDSNGVEP